VPVSALNGEGVSDLLENIIVIAEVSELKANPHQRAKGVVIEAKIDKNRGPVATVLVQTGTLEVGDVVVAKMLGVASGLCSMTPAKGLELPAHRSQWR
jgi:translation initiation factor IF-2